MATEKELYEALKESLEKSGELGKLRAEMRAVILKTLNNSQDTNRPGLPIETHTICELIREFLDWQGFQYTSSMLVCESAISERPMERSVLMQDIGVTDDDAGAVNLPLLYSLVAAFRERVTN